MRTTFTTMFFIKKTKLLKNGNAPIYLRLTVNGKSAETSIKRDCPIMLWDIKKYKVKGNSELANEVNQYLRTLENQIYTHHKNLIDNAISPTPKQLINLTFGIENSQKSLFDIIEIHNTKMESLVNIEYSPLTLQRHLAAQKHLKSFLKYQFK